MNVRSVDYLSKEKKAQNPNGNAQVADTSTLGQNGEVALTQEVTVGPPKPQFNLADLEKKIPKAFRGYVKPVMEWAQSVEERLNAIQQEMPAQIQGAMEAAIENAQNKQRAAMQQMSQNVPQGGGGLGTIGQLLPMFLGGGGGGMNEQMQKLQEEMFRVNIESMKTDISVGKALKNALVSKLGGKIVSEVIP